MKPQRIEDEDPRRRSTSVFHLRPHECRYQSRGQARDRRRTARGEIGRDRPRRQCQAPLVQNVSVSAEALVEWAEERDITAMRELTGWKLDEYETFRRGSDVSPATLNGEMQTLKNWLEYLARIDVVDEDLPEKVHVPTIPDGEESNDEMLEPEAAKNCFELCGQILHTTGQ